MPFPVKHGTSPDGPSGPSQDSGRNKAFTLVEVVLALGVFAVLIVGCIALLSLSSNSLRDVVTRDEAIHLTGAVKQHLNQLSFTDAYNAVLTNLDPGSTNSCSLYVCTYRGQSSATNSDGTPAGYTGNERTAGEAYVVVPTIRAANAQLTDDIRSREGRIFRVIFTPSTTNPIPLSPVPPASAYTEAVVTVQAKFYPLLGDSPQGNYTKVPSQTCTFSILR